MITAFDRHTIYWLIEHVRSVNTAQNCMQHHPGEDLAYQKPTAYMHILTAFAATILPSEIRITNQSKHAKSNGRAVDNHR